MTSCLFQSLEQICVGSGLSTRNILAVGTAFYFQCWQCSGVRGSVGCISGCRTARYILRVHVALQVFHSNVAVFPFF